VRVCTDLSCIKVRIKTNLILHIEGKSDERLELMYLIIADDCIQGKKGSTYNEEKSLQEGKKEIQFISF
jgi:hypothetical protein